MNIIIGIGVLLVLVAIIIFEISLINAINKYQPPQEEERKIIEKPIETKLTKEEREKQENLRKNFESLMGYGYEQALKGGEIKEDR